MHATRISERESFNLSINPALGEVFSNAPSFVPIINSKICQFNLRTDYGFPRRAHVRVLEYASNLTPRYLCTLFILVWRPEISCVCVVRAEGAKKEADLAVNYLCDPGTKTAPRWPGSSGESIIARVVFAAAFSEFSTRFFLTALIRRARDLRRVSRAKKGRKRGPNAAILMEIARFRFLRLQTLGQFSKLHVNKTNQLNVIFTKQVGWRL